MSCTTRDNMYSSIQPYAEWIGLSSVLRPRQQSTGYMGDGFYRSKDPTNSTEGTYSTQITLIGD